MLNDENIIYQPELRWILEGSKIKDVYDWFLSDDNFGTFFKDIQEKPRTDSYFKAKGAPYISPKLREGKFEIKIRDVNLDKKINFVNNSFEGNIEFWHKWKWRFAEVDEDKNKNSDYNKKFAEKVVTAFTSFSKDNIFNVEKKRLKRKFDIIGNELKPVKEIKTLGVQFELTELDINGSPWWTTAIEIMDFTNSNINPFDHLDLCLNKLYKHYSGTKLTYQNSLSYPSWVANL
jgi:hypothetical protein